MTPHIVRRTLTARHIMGVVLLAFAMTVASVSYSAPIRGDALRTERRSALPPLATVDRSVISVTQSSERTRVVTHRAQRFAETTEDQFWLEEIGAKTERRAFLLAAVTRTSAHLPTIASPIFVNDDRLFWVARGEVAQDGVGTWLIRTARLDREGLLDFQDVTRVVGGHMPALHADAGSGKYVVAWTSEAAPAERTLSALVIDDSGIPIGDPVVLGLVSDSLAPDRSFSVVWAGNLFTLAWIDGGGTSELRSQPLSGNGRLFRPVVVAGGAADRRLLVAARGPQGACLAWAEGAVTDGLSVVQHAIQVSCLSGNGAPVGIPQIVSSPSTVVALGLDGDASAWSIGWTKRVGNAGDQQQLVTTLAQTAVLHDPSSFTVRTTSRSLLLGVARRVGVIDQANLFGTLRGAAQVARAPWTVRHRFDGNDWEIAVTPWGSSDAVMYNFTDNDIDDRYPHGDDYVVWQQRGAQSWDIRGGARGQSSSVITSDVEDDQLPRTDGTYVVWQRAGKYGWQVLLHDRETGRQIVVSPEGRPAQQPDIADGVIAWMEWIDGQWDVVSFRPSSGTRTRVTATAAQESDVRVDHEGIGWLSSNTDRRAVMMRTHVAARTAVLASLARVGGVLNMESRESSIQPVAWRIRRPTDVIERYTLVAEDPVTRSRMVEHRGVLIESDVARYSGPVSISFSSSDEDDDVATADKPTDASASSGQDVDDTARDLALSEGQEGTERDTVEQQDTTADSEEIDIVDEGL
jgi:hypothetical protein